MQPTCSASGAMPVTQLMLFAVTAGVCVANVYLAQPLLDSLALAFAVSPGVIGSVVTATQVGSLLALLLLVPLSDRYDRRNMLLFQVLGLVLALLAVAMAESYFVLLAAMLAVGTFGTAMTQGIIAFAASSAASHERGRVVGMTQSGVIVGLLLARVWAGGLADLLGWRGVYFASAALVTGVAVFAWKGLPRLQSSKPSLSYTELLRSTVGLLVSDPILRQRGMLGALLFAAFNIFWSSMALPLSAEPFSLSHSAVGAFGLLGALGAIAAGRAGRSVDRGRARHVSGVALTLMLFAWLPLAAMQVSLWSFMLGVILLDLGCQALHVTNQSLILRGPVEAHGRLIACYMLFYAVGSGAGALVSTLIFEFAGWTAVCMLGACVSLAAMVFWWATDEAPRAIAQTSEIRPLER